MRYDKQGRPLMRLYQKKKAFLIYKGLRPANYYGKWNLKTTTEIGQKMDNWLRDNGIPLPMTMRYKGNTVIVFRRVHDAVAFRLKWISEQKWLCQSIP